MKSAFIAIAFMLTAEAAFVDPPTPNIGGIYHVSGVVHAEGKEAKYNGSAIIRHKPELERIVGITFTSAKGAVSGGVGLISKDGKSLSLSWTTIHPEGSLRGVTVYAIEGKTLRGEWATGGSDAISSETLKFLRKVEDDEI